MGSDGEWKAVEQNNTLFFVALLKVVTKNKIN